MQKCKELNNGNHKSIFFKNKRTHRRNRTESGKSEPRRRRKRFYIVSSQRAEQSQASFHQGAFKARGLFQVLAVFYAGTGGMQFSAVAQNRAARIFRQTQGIDRSQRAQIFSYEKIGAEKGLSLHVQNWLSGKYIPNVYNLVRLAKLLDCSVDYLLGRE